MLGEKLLKLRESKGFTREKLAELSGVPYGTIRHYEYGRSEPTFQNVCLLANAMGVPITEFVSSESNVSTPVKRPRGRPKKAAQ